MATESKHAYLIIAHANWYVLEKLILLLDDERNDIYIHVDAKTTDFDFSYFEKLPQFSKLVFTARVDVRWGHVSQIEAELILFRTAFEGGEYSYYHLISGVDLPIKSQDYIHRFFKENGGKEFIGFSNDLFDREKVSKVHLFPKYQRIASDDILQRVGRKLRMSFLSLQRSVGYDYTKAVDTKFIHGCNWVSITHNLVCDLLAKEDWILHFYRYSNCGDEIYKHTFVYNSEYKNSICDFDNEMASCSRFMDWKRGNPYTFRKEDFKNIMSSELLFARKFEDDVDKEIVDQIYDAIKNR